MPFTLSHPAAVLPLMRSPLVPAALVCGAMAPDVPYFLGATGLTASAQAWYGEALNATYSHSFDGLWLSLLFGLLLFAGYLPARRPVVALLPARLMVTPPPGRAAAGGSPGAAAAWAGWVVVSVGIGVLTHVAWDALIREGSGGALARVLQVLSTLGGLVAIAIYLRARRSAADRPGPRRDRLPRGVRGPILGALGLGTLLGAVVLMDPASYVHEWTAGTLHLESLLSHGVKATAASGLLVAALYVAGWWIRHAASGASGRPVEPVEPAADRSERA
ncbi:DUF4184 family protein [Streptomyces bohaiensis]|uniref:DUF4184 family protein n=2 Tax=Streptomyces bohaiensis TaxID=1431344 RepID=A0ABX1CEA3_9ACTN|nr:DUF4184 family protein [Streptomyces bohaiensis]NJQ15519.1 DUF4184 family protein [Streptomyces bohaiensis]